MAIKKFLSSVSQNEDPEIIQEYEQKLIEYIDSKEAKLYELNEQIASRFLTKIIFEKI